MTNIKYINKNIITVSEGIVAHGVNTHGVMGSGAALAVKNQWSKAYEDYANLCSLYSEEQRPNLLGTVQIVDIADKLYVANCFSQLDFGNDGKKYASLEAVREAYENVIAFAAIKQLPVYTVKIGSLRGGLDWEKEVRPVLEEICAEYGDAVQVYVCDL